MGKSVLCLAVLLAALAPAGAQDTPSQADAGPPPEATAATRMEAFDAVPGRAVIIGYTRVGTARGLYDSAVTVECHEHVDTVTGRRCYGLAFDVDLSAPGSPMYRHSTVYVDYDEVDALIRGLREIAQVDRRRTTLDNCRVEFRTRGGLYVGTLEADSGGNSVLVVGRDQAGYPRAGFAADAIYELSRLVTDARSKLDAARRAAGEVSPPKPAHPQPGGGQPARRGARRG